MERGAFDDDRIPSLLELSFCCKAPWMCRTLGKYVRNPGTRDAVYLEVVRRIRAAPSATSLPAVRDINLLKSWLPTHPASPSTRAAICAVCDRMARDVHSTASRDVVQAIAFVRAMVSEGLVGVYSSSTAAGGQERRAHALTERTEQRGSSPGADDASAPDPAAFPRTAVSGDAWRARPPAWIAPPLPPPPPPPTTTLRGRRYHSSSTSSKGPHGGRWLDLWGVAEEAGQDPSTITWGGGGGGGGDDDGASATPAHQQAAAAAAVTWQTLVEARSAIAVSRQLGGAWDADTPAAPVHTGLEIRAAVLGAVDTPVPSRQRSACATLVRLVVDMYHLRFMIITIRTLFWLGFTYVLQYRY
jgi:hypothetical protein